MKKREILILVNCRKKRKSRHENRINNNNNNTNLNESKRKRKKEKFKIEFFCQMESSHEIHFIALNTYIYKMYVQLTPFKHEHTHKRNTQTHNV